MNFVKSSLKYPQVTLTVLVLVFIIGVYSLLNMPRREDPKITIRQGLIIALLPGANSAQVEDQVTKKLEQYLFQYEEVKKENTYSTTRDGEVVINVELEEWVESPDVFWSKLRHQLLIAKVLDLPQGVIGPLVNSDFGDTEALVIGIESNKATYAQLKDYTQKLEDGLRAIEAVSKIKRIGEQKEQIVITSNTEKLVQYGISLSQVIQVLQSQNAINPTGNVNTYDSKVPLYTKGYYTTEKEIGNQIIGTSKTGEVVRLIDVANIKREYEEPASKTTVNSENAMMLAVEMQEGNNIVNFGKDVKNKMDEVSRLFPSDVKLITIVNQPKIVDENVTHFIHEFFLAIISVIIVVILLLPFRIAAVAATAIPMTVAVTFALLHAFGIELHQVSLAALIVVLGMVVDDAIVIADNYVELLDKGIDRKTAAWRSATDLVIPVLTATVTIIAAFLPMIILTGSVGEFIYALPITVTIALASSFIVAMVLTPMLCYTFIKKGLKDHSDSDENKKKKFSVLDILQSGYDGIIQWCMKHPKISVLSSILTIAGAVLLFFSINQKFFPAAERNQFVVELWMPTGTKLDKTEESIFRVEKIIKEDKRVINYATFIGTSAPRFYYNYSPEVPVTNYAQILINTETNEEAELFAGELSRKVNSLIPEGDVQVKLMQQGTHTIAPIEIRIIGDDLTELKKIGLQVQDILHNINGTSFVRTDFMQDYYGVDIQLKDDAKRLGFTTTSIAKMIYVGFKGAPVTTMYEGNNSVNIVLRLDEESRRNFTDLQNMYLASPVTGADVPLRQIAQLNSQWYTGRIMHRNGIRTLTVQSETKDGVLPSQVLSAFQTELNKISLPVGYRIEYGGEYEGKVTTFSQLEVALGISLVLIFIIILFQFRNIKESILVMISIPLSLFGAFLGLLLTHNNFGFTAFVGLISLSGIVVRNAIILIDYTNELIRKGVSIPVAALEAGKRRLRPIFLTASAAAIGVIPMIISGSQLWSPLASVIAVGVLFSMVMSLLVVPVLYVMIMKPKDKKHFFDLPIQKETGLIKNNITIPVIIFIIVLTGAGVNAQEAEKINLDKATELAVKNNNLLNIKQLQIEEKKQKVNEDKVKFYPSLMINSTYQYNTDMPSLTIDKGSFGKLPMGSLLIPLPSDDKTFILGNHNIYNASFSLYQPISQLGKINSGVQVSKTELEITITEKAKATLQIKQAVEKLYYGILIAQKQKEESEIKLTLAKIKLYDVESALLAGKTIEVSRVGLQASVAEEEQNLLKLNIQIDDYIADLKHLTGITTSKKLQLDSVSYNYDSTKLMQLDNYINEASEKNNDLKIALLTKTKSENAITASKFSFLPDFGLMLGYSYQHGSDLYPSNNAFVGLAFKWNIQDIFSNNFSLRQRQFLKLQSETNIKETREQVNTEVEKAFRKLRQLKELMNVAQKVVEYRKEDLKVQGDKRFSGLNLEADYLTSKAALAKAESDLYAAQLGYRIALSDLKILTGDF
jgi:multidrug efflux pump subunit AcrB/outer membrane protein TolC